MKKRILTCFLAVMMIMTLFPMYVLADEDLPETEETADVDLTEDTAEDPQIQEEESTEPVTFTTSDGGIEVQVTVPSDALPQGAELSVTVSDGKDEESEVQEKTADTAQEADSFTFSAGEEEEEKSGTAILDISFTVDGKKVEPTKPADVVIDASALLEDCKEEVESFEIWHIEETSKGENPVLVEEVSDPDEAAEGIAEFSVDSFSEFEFHYNCSASGWAGFGANLIDENGSTISATVTGYSSALTDGRYTTTVDMPYTFTIDEFVEHFTTDGAYAFQYATVTDPNYGDTEHTFDEWTGEAQVGAKELYGSKENPVVSVTIDGTAAAENPNYDPNNTGAVVSKTWHFTLTYADDTSVTIPIYGNADGANDNGGKYCPKFLEINLYYETGKEAVLNLGNGNGTYSDGDYTGSKASGGAALRYGTGALNTYADENNKVTINLPSDDGLNAEFTVADAVGTEGEAGYQPAITIELGKEEAYDYKLIGWINIATGKYYDVSDGAKKAEIDLSDNNVFYADWIAASYDHGSSTDENLREDTVSTSSFVKLRMFDYNELFDLYSVSLNQDGTEGETWTDSEKLYSEPLLGKTDLTSIGDSFIFQNNMTTRNAVHVLSHANPVRWNLWTKSAAWDGYPEYDFVLDAGEYWDITSPDSTILGMLYDTDEKSLGVHYVGEADDLFWIDNEGYYVYDSAVSGAAYNQSEGRFYVYGYDGNDDHKKGFFPYNNHTDDIITDTENGNGITNYWFGLNMEVNLYVPSATSAGSEGKPVNQIDEEDMVFDFSGDDDIMIFIDDKMVVDMSGIHGTSYSRINFSTNTVTYSMGLDENGAPDTTGASGKYSVNNNLNLSAGNHTMKIFYMERGASASNLKVRFNVASAWEYETGPVQTVTAEKTWKNADGTVITDTSLMPEVEVGLFDALGEAQEATDDEDGKFGYTKNGAQYTVTYEDDSGIKHTYVYDSSGPTLTYTEDYEASVTYSEVNADGQVLDCGGLVIAWLEDETLHIRIDTQTLKEENGWSYAWELLDPDADYEVLELTTGSTYTTTTTSTDLETHKYWTIIGEDEIESRISDSDFSVILTEAAQEAVGTVGDTKEAYGWVIVGTADGSVATKKVKFSQAAAWEGVQQNNQTPSFKGTYGVTSQSEIDALGSGAIWYVEDTGEMYDELSLEEFYLSCKLGGETYYLTLDQNSNTLKLTQEEEYKARFYYDDLGELMVEVSENNTVRVEIQDDGTISLGQAEMEAAKDDVRIYTLTDTATSGFAFTATNTFLPDITLNKVDSETKEALSDAAFTLQNAADQYYSYDPDTDEVTWVTKPEDESWEAPTVITGVDGTVIFHYLEDGTYTLKEVSAPDDHISITDTVMITVATDADGKTTVTVSGSKSATASEDELIVTIANEPVQPKITKEVVEDDYERKEESGESMHDGEDTDGDGWGTWDDADNNQEVTHHLKLTDLESVKNLTVHDYLEEGMDFEPETIDIKLHDGESERTLEAGTDYTLTQGSCSDPECSMAGCTFEVKFEDSVLEGISSDAYIVITYKALTETHTEDYDDYEDEVLNHAYLTYGTSMLRRSGVVTTATDLFGFGIYKYAKGGALADAKFILSKRDDSDSQTVYAALDTETDDGKTYYMVSSWVESKDDATELVSATDGYIRIEGLDDDTYYLNETEAPADYELLSDTVRVTIDENGNVTVSGSSAAKESSVAHEIEVENTPTDIPGSNRVTISGTKTWDDGSNADGVRPASITIRLYADGKEADSKTVTAEDGWAWRFANLPKYDEDGKEINYTIKEDAVDEYETAYSDADYDVINIHTPKNPNPQPGSPGPGPANPNPGSGGPGTVKTGDTNHIGLWLALLVAAMAAALVALHLRKRS